MSVSGNQARQVVLAAANVSANAAGSSFGGTIAQVIASTTAPILITSVYVYSSNSTAATGATINVTTGPAASETTIYSVTASLAGSSTSSGGGGLTAAFALPYPIRVPASTRVGVSSSSPSALSVGITYVLESSVV